jgi:hypothetical protein
MSEAMNTENISQVPSAAESQGGPLAPSDFATGFVSGYLRAQGITGTPTVPEFREALAELTEHLSELRHNAH